MTGDFLRLSSVAAIAGPAVLSGCPERLNRRHRCVAPHHPTKGEVGLDPLHDEAVFRCLLSPVHAHRFGFDLGFLLRDLMRSISGFGEKTEINVYLYTVVGPSSLMAIRR